MKKIILSVALFLLALPGFTQTCEEREAKLLESIGSLSAVYVYNTFTAIGSITDGYLKDAYKADFAVSILDEQENMLTVIIENMEGLVRDKSLKSQDDINYVKELSVLMKGLKKQSSLGRDFIKTAKTEISQEFEKQRKANWKKISDLLGIENKDDE